MKNYKDLRNGQQKLSVFYYKLYLLLSLFAATFMNAQSVTGIIYDTDNKVIPGAIVSLIDLKNDDIVHYTLTSKDGFFKMDLVEKEAVKISINAIGYRKKEVIININTDGKKNYILTKDEEQSIEEVILTHSNPIKIKSDTVEMNAKSFVNGTEKNVEDLLRKLPGVTVEEDGKIKIAGKEIEKVMVENDDFFEKGYTLLTKNMSVKPIEKVQILQNYSNNKLLKCVENSDKVAINLTLEDNVKRDWFGSASLSSSFFPESFYSEKLNLAKFGKKTKYFLAASTNTIGHSNTGDIGHLIKPSIEDEPGFINVDEDAYRFGVDSFIFLPFGSQKAKFNNDKLLSANTIFNLTNKMKLKITSLVNFEKNSISKKAITDFNFQDTQFTNVEEFFRASKKNDYFNKIDFEHDISKNTTLKYSANLSYWNNYKNEHQIFNGLPLEIDQKTNNFSTDHNILLTDKVNENIVWLNSIRFLKQNISNRDDSNQFFFEELVNDFQEIQNYNQTSNSKFQFLGFISQLLYRTQNENLWDISVYNYNKTQKFDNLMGYKNGSVEYFFPEAYKNYFENINNDFAFSLKHTASFKNFKINPKLDVHFTKNQLKYANSNNEKFFYFIPSLNFSWAVHNKGKLNASLFLSRNSTGVLEIMPNYFSQTSRNLIRGVSNFEYLKNSGATLKYSYGDWSDRVFINIYGSYTNFHNYLSYNYNITQAYSIANLISLRNRKDYILSGEFNYYLKKIRSNFKITYANSTSLYEDQINDGNFRQVASLYNRIGLQLKSGWKKNINYNIGTNLNISKITTDQQSSKVINQQAFFELIFALNKKTKIELKNSYYSFNGYFNKDNSYDFMDFKLTYDYSKSISLSLIGNNLFNVVKFKETSITSYSAYTSEYSLFPRYVMLELNFGL
ncbi:carboxypeptidase regulatory-like domain-containing protein [Chryseobacterium sp. 2R14A]|uniref:carboxypeptidase regulatory-like domain-containing protein n=1 Tax=Chryseobacterium sp. 2R14A TaxID=3380353 RepID=UPI003CFA8FA6